jgi:hypothetical protein
VGLDDLPEHRRDALLWRYAMELDYNGVDDLVRRRAKRECRVLWEGDCTEWTDSVAVLGDDGRYHWLVDGKPRCLEEYRGRVPAGAIRHEDRYFWWTDGTRYQVQVPADAWGGDALLYGERGNRTVRWLVRLTEVVTDPVLVPTRQRCVHSTSRTDWPGYQEPETPEGRQRVQLAAALGRACHACRTRPGANIDHDHFTGFVRGLLCRYCNSHVDGCPHASGCAWADYLNNPPAAPLRLRYPTPERVYRSSRTAEKIAFLGFDPLYRGQAVRRRLPGSQIARPPTAGR